MEIIILAGGMGKRLRPLSENMPKCMVPVNDRPLLDYQLEWLGKYKISSIVLACGYKWEHIKQHYGDRFVYSVEKEPLGTAGAVKLALAHIEGDEYIVLNADDLTNVNLNDLIRFGSNATVVANFHSQFGIVDMNDGKIVQFREKPLLPYWANTGLHLLNKGVKMPAKGSLEQDVLPILAKEGKLKAYKHTGFWQTVNTVKELEEVEVFFKNTKMH
ncbi:MAG: nucleotidyltransferase family protein [Candidatus Aenigmarchaeota archaeon]|nr:nucleotidyltransferase family protein [Candidatus Aenigmarchaeota archaeon]